MKNYFTQLTALLLMISSVLVGQQRHPEIANHLPGVVIAKVKPEFRGLFRTGRAPQGMQSKLALNSLNVEQRFPGKKVLRSAAGQLSPDLGLIYTLKIEEHLSVPFMCDKLMSLGYFEYVEPHYLPQLLHVPNDPGLGSQYFLESIKAYDAWDIQKGDTNVVIGIIDTGIEPTHDDIKGNIKYNYADPVNGLDDDNDGFVDNFTGYDLGDYDNDPTVHPALEHGLWVSGYAAETPNNGIQGAGAGYNCKVLPVKVSNSSGQLSAAYEGMVYAADRGADIINCSWGAPGTWSQYGQDIVNYVHAKGVLIVAASGNSDAEDLFYPASYDNVLCAGGTDSTDKKWTSPDGNGAQYNHMVDLCAPSIDNYTTFKNNEFKNPGGGTSFSSPIIAGCAAIVKSQFPSYTPDQIEAQLKVTADNIDTVATNSGYVGKLGAGRVNLFRAVTETNHSFVQITDLTYNGGDGQSLLNGDTVSVVAALKNILGDATDVKVVLATTNDNVTILDSLSTVGVLAANGETTTDGDELKFVISANCPQNEQLELLFYVYANGDADVNKQAVYLRVNRDYLDVDFNNITTTVTSRGRVGFNNQSTAQGIGFKYKGGINSLFYEMSFSVATAADKISSAYYGHFSTVDQVQLRTPAIESDQDAVGKFNDANAGATKLNVSVAHKTLGWQEAGHEDYILLEYCLKNEGDDVLADAYAGFYVDWDLGRFDLNYAKFDTSSATGVVCNADSLFSGIRYLGDTSLVNYYAFDNNGSSGILTYDGLSLAEIFQALSGTDKKWSSGMGDVSQMMSAGPITLAPGDSIKLPFVILVGSGMNDVRETVDSAQAKYTAIRTIDVVADSISNVGCYGDSTGMASVSGSGGVPPYSYTWSGPLSKTGASVENLISGNYTVQIQDAVGNINTVSVGINEPDSLAFDSLTVTMPSCNGECDGEIYVVVEGGTEPYSYVWDRGVISVPNPDYLCAGTYVLNVTDNNGCKKSLSVDVDEAPVLEVSVTDTSAVSAKNECDGKAKVAISGGAAPFTISWDEQAGVDSASTLCAGNHTVSVTDSLGCKKEVSFEIPDAIVTTQTVEALSFQVYPVPVKNEMIVRWADVSEAVEIRIYDLLGNRLNSYNVEPGIDEQKIEMQQYVPGIYLVELQRKEATIVRKIHKE